MLETDTLMQVLSLPSGGSAQTKGRWSENGQGSQCSGLGAKRVLDSVSVEGVDEEVVDLIKVHFLYSLVLL